MCLTFWIFFKLFQEWNFFQNLNIQWFHQDSIYDVMWSTVMLEKNKKKNFKN